MALDSSDFSELMTGLLIAAKSHHDSSTLLESAKCQYSGTNLYDMPSDAIPSQDILTCLSKDGGGNDYWVDAKLKTATYASDHVYRLLHSEMEEYKLIQANFKGDYTCKEDQDWRLVWG